MQPPETNAPRRPPARRKDTVWNLLTGLVILFTVCLIGGFLLVFANPYVPFNIFPPPAIPTEIVLPSATATEIFPATWTPTLTESPDNAEPTSTPLPPTPSNTPFALATEPADTPIPGVAGTPTRTATIPVLPYSLRGTAVAVASTIIHADLGCDWLGVGGQAFGLQGEPVVGLTIQLSGTLNGQPVSMLGLTGTIPQYGPAGYEFTLGDKPATSIKTLWVQLLDQAGLPLSEKVYFDTYNDCQKNLILINFKQVR